MVKPGEGREIRQLARVRPEALERCLAAIREFVAYVRVKERGTLRYEVWQEREDPTRFVHIFVFRDGEADKRHSESPEVKKFASVLYPEFWRPWSSSITIRWCQVSNGQIAAGPASPRPFGAPASTWRSDMKKAGAPGIALFVVGIVFLAVGSSGRPGLLGVGAAFAVIGLVLLLRHPRSRPE